MTIHLTATHSYLLRRLQHNPHTGLQEWQLIGITDSIAEANQWTKQQLQPACAVNIHGQRLTSNQAFDEVA